VGVMVGGKVVFAHRATLTVEPGFKSSDRMPESLLTIGEVARRAHVATSTVRYYGRRGLLAADARTSGQRRYRPETLRRLVFIGMLQDAGLALDDIGGILDAADTAEWKAIAGRRLEHLDEQIRRLQEAREYLAGALLCRYDHPATDCKVMGFEIDRRLTEATTD
jgi:DNA-binding transcriptional MerR regulator